MVFICKGSPRDVYRPSVPQAEQVGVNEDAGADVEADPEHHDSNRHPDYFPVRSEY